MISTHAMRAAPLLLLLLAGCRFDVHGPGASPCTRNADCPADQECDGARCAYRTCAQPSDCGTAQQFLCGNGTCLAVTCDSTTPCDDGYSCGADGYCWTVTCVPSQEGPPGSDTCHDGIDNDCDGRTDGDDPNCQPCQKDGDCDDGKACNGVETCVDHACVKGTPVECTPSSSPCLVPYCDDTIATGNPCVLLPVDDGTACDDDDPCTENDRCASGACVGAAKDCSDGASCTDDSCDPTDGSCRHEPDDAKCNNYEVCKPACFATATGCGVPPAGLTVVCTSPATATSGSACTVSLAGTSGQAACVDCEARSAETTAFYSDFDNGYGGCTLDGWSFAATSPCNDTNSVWCVSGFAGTPALQVDKAECAGKTAAVERTVDTTGMARVELCFDYADNGATGGNDYLMVEYDPTGTGASLTQLFYDVDGPLPGLDDTWLRYCLELPADALGQPSVLLRLTLHSNDDHQAVYLGDVAVLGFPTGCALANVPFASTFASCATSGWTVTGQVQCPGFLGDALEANGTSSSWTLDRTVDTTLLDGDLVLRFDLAEDGTTNDDSFAVAINATGSWRTVFYQNGPLRPDQGATTFVVNLATLEPATLGNPALKLRFTATSSANNHKLDLDNVSLTAYAGTCVAQGVVLSAPTDQGNGNYGFSVTAPVPLPVQVVCSWGGEASLTDSASVPLTP